MDKLIDLTFLESEFRDLLAWAVDNVLTIGALAQAATILAAAIVARIAAPSFRRGTEGLARKWHWQKGLGRVTETAATLSLPIIWLILQWISVVVANSMGWPNQFIRVTVSLLTAWVVIRLVSQLVRDPTWSKIVAVSAWTLAALNILETANVR